MISSKINTATRFVVLLGCVSLFSDMTYEAARSISGPYLYQHVINAGSVGKPKHGNNKACYVLLDINGSIQLNDPSSIAVQFFYVPYDVEKVIEKIHANGLGNAYDDFLLNGEV